MASFLTAIVDDRNPSSDRLRRLASRYEAGVGRGRAEQIAARAVSRAHSRASTGRRLAVAVSSSAFMLVSMTGIGVAADRAVPGDLLYPVDRALEAVGLSSDLVEERLLEAISLTERGEMALAIETANEALAQLGQSGVTATLPPVTSDPDTITAETVEPDTTTTTEELSEPDEPNDQVDAADEPDTVVEATPAPADAVEALRLAAEQLLASVRSAKSDSANPDDVTNAALFLAEATANVTSVQLSVETTTSSSTSTSTTSSTTTTTTVAENPASGDPEGNDEESGTTTTTVTSDPDDGSGSDDSSGGGENGSKGPIFLPSP